MVACTETMATKDWSVLRLRRANVTILVLATLSTLLGPAGAVRAGEPGGAAAARPAVDAGDTGWVLVSAALVLLMTPALIIGALAERMKPSALCLFVRLWATLVYDPVST
jgi:hypothetical protein